MDEYASIRLTLRCGIASTLPTIIVSAASQTTSFCQPCGPRAAHGSPNPPTRMRTSVANAATFTAAAMNPVTGAGAPSYTSGTHMWNGTAATLKAKPAARRAAAAKRSVVVPAGAVPDAARRTAFATSPRRVDPVAPYASAAPYRNIADANEPSTKYLNAASAGRLPRRKYADKQ